MLQDEGSAGEGYDKMDAVIAAYQDDGDRIDPPQMATSEDFPGGGVSVVRLVFTAIPNT
jgi:hypothetical protein